MKTTKVPGRAFRARRGALPFRSTFVLVLGLATVILAVTLKGQTTNVPPQKRYEAILAEYNASAAAFQKALSQAANDSERGEAFAKAPDQAAFGKKLLDLAKSFPDDPAAEDALIWIYTFVPQYTYSGVPGQSELAPIPVAEDALELLIERHVTSAKLGEACRMGAHFQNIRNPRTEEFLHQVAELNTNPPVRAQAIITLAEISQNRAKLAASLKEGKPEVAKRLKQTTSAEQFEDLQKTTPDAFSAEAEKLYEKVAAEFPTVPVPNSNSHFTFGDQAKAALLQIRGLAVGQPVPELASVDLGGTSEKLSQYKGKVVVLDVWATWCGPCRQMIPHERELVKRMEGKPFVLVSVSVDAEKDTLKSFLQKEPMPWVHWWNGDKGGIIDQWNIHGYPAIFVLDTKGTIRFRDKLGKELDAAVDQLIQEAAARN